MAIKDKVTYKSMGSSNWNIRREDPKRVVGQEEEAKLIKSGWGTGKRTVGADEEARLIRSGWLSTRGTPSAPKAKKVASAPPVSSHSGTPGPQPSKAPAVSATPSATSKGQGQAAPPTRMHTPTTSPGLGLQKPELQKPGMGIGPPVAAVAALGLAYKTGAHKLPIAAAKLPFKMAKHAYNLGRYGSAGPPQSKVAARLAGLPQPSAAAATHAANIAGANAAPTSPTGVAPKINPAAGANSGMPAAAAASQRTFNTPVGTISTGALPKPAAVAGVGKPAKFAGPKPIKPASTATPPTPAAPAGSSLPKPNAPAATPPAQKPKIDQAMDLAKKIKGEKAATEAAQAGKTAAHEARVAEVVKSVTEGMPKPATETTAPAAKKPLMPKVKVFSSETITSPAAQKPARLGSPEQLGAAFAKAGAAPAKPKPTVRVTAEEAAAVEKHWVGAAEEELPKPSPAPKKVSGVPQTPPKPRPKGVPGAPVTPSERLKQGRLGRPVAGGGRQSGDLEMPKPARLGSPEQLNKAFEKAGAVPKAAPKAAPAAAMPQTPAAPSDWDVKAKDLLDKINETKKMPMSPERTTRLVQLQGEAKEHIKTRGTTEVETPVGQRAPARPVTKPAPAKPRVRGAAPGAAPSAAEAARMAATKAGETGIVQPISPPRAPSQPRSAFAEFSEAHEALPKTREGLPKGKAGRSASDELIAKYQRALEARTGSQVSDLAKAVTEDKIAKAAPRPTTIGENLPPQVRDALLKIKQQTVPSAVAPDEDVRTARVKRRPLGPTPVSVEQQIGPKRAPPAAARVAREESPIPRPEKRPGRVRPEINIPQGGEEFVTEAEQKAQRKVAATKGKMPVRGVGGVNLETEVGVSLRGESAEERTARIAKRAEIEQHIAKYGKTVFETPTVEQELAGERPASRRVGPAAPGPQQAAATPEAQATGGMPKPVKSKEAGRFRLPKDHGQGNTGARAKGGLNAGSTGRPPRGGKALGWAGLGLLAYGAAEEARAAAPGQKAAAAGAYAKEAGIGMAKDIAITAGLTATAGPVAAAGYTTYRVGQTAWEAVKQGAAAGAAFYDAYQQRKASEAKWGDKQLQAALAKQRKKGLI